ncbi:hypothetical protein [Spiroplasma poulsonii]|uniref:hypothetical protein n=1 Tax=Spiroplasma poulsonii TaxID=2138 RepID=UPI001057546F|nr:hypothetical protein [Spiroplasma poulsonii]
MLWWYFYSIRSISRRWSIITIFTSSTRYTNLRNIYEDQKSIIEQVYLACHFSSPFGDKSDNDQNKTQSLLTKTKI